MTLTNRGRRVATAALVTLVVVVSWAWILFGFAQGQANKQDRLNTDSGTIPPKVCQEDEGCWDCTTMGNKECGP